MADLLPLFPLNTVLFPGITLPLHIFEDRYRLMFRELLQSPVPRRFGVVAIRQGFEAGDDDVETYDIGCVAEIRRTRPHPNGRLDVVAAGGPRFTLAATDSSRPYLVGRVRYLPEPPCDDDATALARAVTRAFTPYWEVVAEARESDEAVPRLPDDPALLSWVVAASVYVDLPEKQSLLEISDTTARLRAELSLLRRETMLVRESLAREPAPTEGPFSLN